jgi:hypothetical protein
MKVPETELGDCTARKSDEDEENPSSGVTPIL